MTPGKRKPATVSVTGFALKGPAATPDRTQQPSTPEKPNGCREGSIPSPATFSKTENPSRRANRLGLGERNEKGILSLTTSLTSNSFERVRDAAEAAGLNWREVRAGIQASMQTPGHSGRDLGTSVTYTGDQVLVNCFNGDVGDVLDALGLTFRDLFDNPKGSRYEYAGGLAVTRTPAKVFQRICEHGINPSKCDSCKEKLWSLYGLDSLGKAGPVYVVEGEKDVNTARTVHGVAAVSQVGGADPDKTDWSSLKGRDVIVVRDNDKPGHRRAEKVRTHLESMVPAPASVTVVDVAVETDKADLSDHIAAGKDLSELIPVETATPGRLITLESFAGMDWDVATWGWEPDVDGEPHGAIPVGSLSIWAGRPAAGKSSAGRDAAAQVSRGTWPGCWAGTPHSVAYIAGEESLKYNVIPSLIASGADMEKVYRPQVTFTAPDGLTEVVALVPEKDMRDLTEQLKAKGTKLVIVDPLMEYMGNDTDIYKNNEVRAKVRPWAKLAEDIDGIVIAIMHLNKSGNGDVVAGINGSSAFGEVARSIFGFTKDPESEDGDRIMSQEKNSIGTEGAAWVYRIEGKQITNAEGKTGEFGTFVMVGDSDRTVGEVLRDTSLGFAGESGGGVKPFVLDLLKDEGGVAPAAKVKSEVTEAGYSWKTVQNNRGKWGIATRKSETGWVWELESTPKQSGPSDAFKVPEVEEGPHARDVGTLGSSMVTDLKQGPKVPRSQGPAYIGGSGPSPGSSGDTELENTILGCLHAEYPMGLKTVEQSVPPKQRPEVAGALGTLVNDGRAVLDSRGRFLLNSTRKEIA